MFSLPNVEVASHGYAHPLVWQTGKVAVPVPGYLYSPQTETAGSIEKINALLNDLGLSKKVNLYQWTGDCRPTVLAMESLDATGIANINGGDTQFDRMHDSYAFVSPLSIVRGGHRQIYTGATNENIYTNSWRGPYYGFEQVIHTFENTGSPIRIKPINVYYHFYSGERLASLNALKKVYDWALSQNVFAIPASMYSRIAADFFKVQIEKIRDDFFRVTHNGALKTIRFDDESRYVDMGASRGVIGFKHEGKTLYVALDESEYHDIILVINK